MAFGNMHTQKIACANNNGAKQSFANVVSTEKLFKVTPTTDVFVKFVPHSNTTDDADNDDYLIPANQEREFLLGRGLDKILIRNESGGVSAIHVAVLF